MKKLILVSSGTILHGRQVRRQYLHFNWISVVGIMTLRLRQLLQQVIRLRCMHY